MKMKSVIVLAVLGIAPPSALAISKCVTPSGDMIFTNTGCPSGSRSAGEMDYETSATGGGSDGLREGERAALERIREKEANDSAAKRSSRDRDARYQLSYSDQLKIRELEMDKRSLTQSLSWGKKSWAEASAIREEIRGINRQIEQLSAPKW